ncbi:hypothetical protein CSPX01_12997 [Colletotrichum filicis]|nr:hypothetical protein CSPX01_12997 [Colletotrichum filicis]
MKEGASPIGLLRHSYLSLLIWFIRESWLPIGQAAASSRRRKVPSFQDCQSSQVPAPSGGPTHRGVVANEPQARQPQKRGDCLTRVLRAPRQPAGGRSAVWTQQKYKQAVRTQGSKYLCARFGKDTPWPDPGHVAARSNWAISTADIRRFTANAPTPGPWPAAQPQTCPPDLRLSDSHMPRPPAQGPREMQYFLAFSATQTTPHSRPVQIRLISFVRDLSPGSDWSHPLRPSWSTGRAAPVLRDPRHILPLVVFAGSRNPHDMTAASNARLGINSSRRETTS